MSDPVRFLLGRLVHALALLLGVSVLTFLLTELAPGDFLTRLKVDPSVSPETIEAMTERLGLDQSALARYLYWLGSLARLELGYSYRTGTPVAPLVWGAAGRTLVLGGLATLVSWLIALPLGVWAAGSRGRWAPNLAGAANSVLLAVPDVLIALALLLVAVRTGWFPTGGMASLDAASLGPVARLGDLGHHLVLPALALVLTGAPPLFRHIRASLDEVLRSPYMRAVRATGIPRGQRLYRYALPAAANPLVTLFGLSVASLLSASLLIEIIMSWPGIGPLLLSAVQSEDVYVVLGVVMISTALLLFGNLLADLLLYVVDPRITRETG